MLIAANQTVKVTLTGVYGKGYPKLMIKLANVQTTVDADNFVSYDFIDQLSAENQQISIILNEFDRASVNPLCEFAGYANGTEGNINCGIYVGVQCGDDDPEVCAYKI